MKTVIRCITKAVRCKEIQSLLSSTIGEKKKAVSLFANIYVLQLTEIGLVWIYTKP